MGLWNGFSRRLLCSSKSFVCFLARLTLRVSLTCLQYERAEQGRIAVESGKGRKSSDVAVTQGLTDSLVVLILTLAALRILIQQATRSALDGAKGLRV